MAQESLEIALIKYNRKTWCKSALLGFFIGLAVIVPGISGSTVAIIFKLYDQFLYAVGNLFKQFKKCFLFLLPIGIGMVLGLLLGFFTVEKLLAILPFAVVGLFAGLMSGAFPAVKDELKGAQMNGKRISLLVLGVLIPIAIGVISVALEAGAAVRAPMPLRLSSGGRSSCVFPSGMSWALHRSFPASAPRPSLWLSAGLPPSWTASALRSGSRIP